jgi:hypothetical protein
MGSSLPTQDEISSIRLLRHEKEGVWHCCFSLLCSISVTACVVQSPYVFGLADPGFSIYRFNLVKLTVERVFMDGEDWTTFPQDRCLHARSLEVRPPQGTINDYRKCTTTLLHFGEHISSLLDQPFSDGAFHGIKTMLTLTGTRIAGGPNARGRPLP